LFAESGRLIDKLRRAGLHMPNEPLARAMTPPEALSEGKYEALCAALSESGRGRAFLAEYARRNRNADTAVLLAAIERIEAHLRADAFAVQRLRDDLRMLLIAIRLARPEIDAASPVAAKAARLAALLDLLERRIDAMAGTESAALSPSGETGRTSLAVVPSPNEPELPIPSPAGAQLPAVALVSNEAMMLEIAAVEVAAAEPVVPPADPLAAIMALSEDERLALFT
jgi:hypothetical protein